MRLCLPIKSLLLCLLLFCVGGNSFAVPQPGSANNPAQKISQPLLKQLKAAISDNDLERLRMLLPRALPESLWQNGDESLYSPLLSQVTVLIRSTHNYPALELLHQYVTTLPPNADKVRQAKVSYEFVADYMYFSQFDRLFAIYLPLMSTMQQWQPKTTHEQEILATLWFLYSQVLLRKNQSEQALSALFTAERIYQGIQPEHPELYRIYLIIGEVYLHLQRFADAEKYILKGLAGFPSERQDARGYSAALLADSYTEQGKHQLALQTLLQYFENPVDNRTDYQLYVQDIYAKVLQNLRQGDKALRVATAALTLAESYHNLDLINQAKFRLAKSYILLGDVQRAQQLLTEAIASTDINSKLPKPKMYLELVNLLATQKKFEQALTVYKQYKAADEQQLARDNDVQIKDLELVRAQQKAERQQEKLSSLQEKQALQISLVEQEKKNIRIVAIGLLVLVLLLIVVVTTLAILFRTIRRSNQQLSALSLEDPLTKLKNRRYIQSFIEVEAQRLIRARERALILIADIDFFKAINDAHGHHVGDQVLVELAGFLTANFRKEDVIARWGGEEFLIICRSRDEQSDQMICQHIRSQLAKMQFSAQKLSLTLSVGGSYFPHQHIANLSSDVLSELLADWQNQWQLSLKTADDALYRIKTQGRNDFLIERDEDIPERVFLQQL